MAKRILLILAAAAVIAIAGYLALLAELKFDQEAWSDPPGWSSRILPPARERMLRDVTDRVLARGMRDRDVLDLLGKPDGRADGSASYVIADDNWIVAGVKHGKFVYIDYPR